MAQNIVRATVVQVERLLTEERPGAALKVIRDLRTSSEAEQKRQVATTLVRHSADLVTGCDEEGTGIPQALVA